MIFKFVKGDNLNSSKQIFAARAGSLSASKVLSVVPRSRFEPVGKTLKALKPYVVNRKAIALEAHKPTKAPAPIDTARPSEASTLWWPFEVV